MDTTKPIRIYDDRSKGDTFNVDSILFENDEILLVSLIEFSKSPEELCLINKHNDEILTTNFEFYYAENFFIMPTDKDLFGENE